MVFIAIDLFHQYDLNGGGLSLEPAYMIGGHDYISKVRYVKLYLYGSHLQGVTPYQRSTGRDKIIFVLSSCCKVYV